jgi:hypothetical protein
LASAVDQIEDPITDTHKRRGKLGGACEGKSTEGVVRGGRRENVVKKREKRNGGAVGYSSVAVANGLQFLGLASLQGFRELGEYLTVGCAFCL